MSHELEKVKCEWCGAVLWEDDAEDWRGDWICRDCLDLHAVRNEVHCCVCGEVPVADIDDKVVFCANEDCDVPGVIGETMEDCVDRWNEQVEKLEGRA